MKKQKTLTTAWLRLAIIAIAACILPVGLVNAQDIEAVERRLGGGVADGELTLDQAKLMLDALKKATAHAHAGGDIDAKKRKYTAVAREIEAAVKAGKISKEDAQKKLIGLRKEMFGGGESKHRDNREMEAKRKYMAVAREIEAAVKAGKLSKEEAQKKLDGLRKGMFGPGETKDRGDREIEAKRKYTAVAREIEAAVKAGKLSKEEAQKKLLGLRKEMFGAGEMKDRDDRKMDAKKRKFMEAAREIEAAVKAGKISKEEAQKKLLEMRKSFGE